jgi:hypothetical protein
MMWHSQQCFKTFFFEKRDYKVEMSFSGEAFKKNEKCLFKQFLQMGDCQMDGLEVL